MDIDEDRTSRVENRVFSINKQRIKRKLKHRKEIYSKRGTSQQYQIVREINEEKESQVSGINQLFQKIIAENVPKLGKTNPVRYRKHTGHQLDKTTKENPKAYHS